jgi:hypothetical protein
MPANPKYLTTSPKQRFAKISAGILGGYLISALLHMSLALWFPASWSILISSIYTHFLLWCGLLIIPFLFENGWKAWTIYLLVIALLSVVYVIGNQHNPFVI